MDTSASYEHTDLDSVAYTLANYDVDPAPNVHANMDPSAH